MSETLLMFDLVDYYLKNENQRVDMKEKGNYGNYGSRAKSSAAKGHFAESNVNEGYDIVPTSPYWFVNKKYYYFIFLYVLMDG